MTSLEGVAQNKTEGEEKSFDLCALKQKAALELGVLEHDINLSTWEEEAGRSLSLRPTLST